MDKSDSEGSNSDEEESLSSNSKNRVTSVIEKIEQIYSNKFVDGYGTDDSFIDDSEIIEVFILFII